MSTKVFLALQGGGRTTAKDTSLSVWLMSPGVIFDTFAAKAHATILASGTLAPLGALGRVISLLNLNFLFGLDCDVLEIARGIARSVCHHRSAELSRNLTTTYYLAVT